MSKFIPTCKHGIKINKSCGACRKEINSKKPIDKILPKQKSFQYEDDPWDHLYYYVSSKQRTKYF
jgi:hypothetical protein